MFWRKKIDIRTKIEHAAEAIKSDLTIDLWLYEMGTQVAHKRNMPFIPQIGSKIEVTEDGDLFLVEDVHMSCNGFTAHIYGKRVRNEYPLHH